MVPNANDEILFTFIAVTLVLFILIAFIISFAFLFQRKQFQYRQEKQALAEAYERELLQSQLEIQNQTLRRIGEELHDHIGQMLSLTVLQLNVLKGRYKGNPDEQQAIGQPIETVRSIIQDVRGLTKSLDIGTVERYGLAESLGLELDRIQRTGRFETKLEIRGEPYPLGPEPETVLFRMAQESLNNAIKHSEGRQLAVTASYGMDRFQLTIADDGQGFSPEEVSQRNLGKSGSGLYNLRRRASLLGGECRLSSLPGEGTKVLIELPRQKA